MTKRISFFALRSDLLPILKELEDREPVTYTFAGTMPTSELLQWSHAADIEGLGKADGEQTMACRSFLITKAGSSVVPSRIEQYDSNVRFDVDQMLNPDSILLTPAGEWKREIIIAGLCATLSSSSPAQALMRVFSTAVKKRFTRINAYWIGPEALLRFRTGSRLTMAEQSPPIYDLRESS